MANLELKNSKICIIGLGYVGLPLAVEFSKKFSVLGFDINERRVEELRQGVDVTLETSGDDLKDAERLKFTTDTDKIKDSNVYIVTVPTPVDEYKRPVLTPLIRASETVGKVLKKGDVVIYESTVYPGATEEECVPVLEKTSGLKFNSDFFVGYSPERINPGDKEHRLTTIIKVTSGSNHETAKFIDSLYSEVVTVGTHRASSIKVAEASKVIENIQRDVNIALVNELAIIFDKMNIDTLDVLKASGTKWNFLPFRPGLVGGHCIGVDPYYLTHKAQALGYYPEVVLSGRRINDKMGEYVAQKLIKEMIRRGGAIKNCEVLIMGLSFKENCPDLRNTRVVDIISELETYGVNISVYDPWVNAESAFSEYGIKLIDTPKNNYYDSILVPVAHQEFAEQQLSSVKAYGKSDAVVFDLKGIFNRDKNVVRL